MWEEETYHILKTPTETHIVYINSSLLFTHSLFPWHHLLSPTFDQGNSQTGATGVRARPHSYKTGVNHKKTVNES